ncbi:UDP-4-amino-4,6-dideoxy-N-acetyl-beta-L-altrosamine N-acetyltransferase [Brevibacillus fulvus]|uniref:UDP-4-amino-4, 6-dideoxy-N-acetyl-beta-L-altrosamine N-acetyltransferase n=1 Tax=Brevibacillus fulvus TaxID=1125967 RepID=A0A938XWJ2_9BACL|nr:UDP-4-amino-4,6-dideoxy-N-acetyl-beta-L-altrosamine N-acetyltransferase [Brevibacillus fulvus]MBM7591487.1 UDP-4-amino-4,6-dideoxy-N-acetyl-beta-L-altrosamine N-acetyltransferase [Brevibacillus fulvus]
MITFNRLAEKHLEQVLKWRTQEDVTRYMYTDVAYDMEKQKKWYERVSQSDSDKYWVIAVQQTPIGVISLNQIDTVNKRASSGFYIGEEKYRVYGGIIPLFLYNYAFNQLDLNKVTAEVMEGNENIRKIHLLHGYREVGYYKDHIYKYGTFHHVYLLELLKEDWQQKADKYQRYTAVFE